MEQKVKWCNPLLHSVDLLFHGGMEQKVNRMQQRLLQHKEDELNLKSMGEPHAGS